MNVKDFLIIYEETGHTFPGWEEILILQASEDFKNSQYYKKIGLTSESIKYRTRGRNILDELERRGYFDRW